MSNKKNKNKQNKKAKGKKADAGARAPASGFRVIPKKMSAQCDAYCRLLCDPFNAPVVGSPALPSYDSQKLTCYTRGAAVVGTGNRGFVSLNIANFAASDGGGMCYSTSGWLAADFGTGGTTTGVNSYDGNSPYAKSTFSTDPADLRVYRPIAAGLRIRWAGTEDSWGGRVLAYRSPHNFGSSGSTYGPNDISGDLRTTMFSDKKSVEINWIPTGRTSGLSPNSYGATFAANDVSSLDLLLMFDTPTSAGMFYFEGVAHYEVVSDGLPGQTPNRPDDAGASKVQTAMQAVSGKSSAKTHSNTVMKYIGYAEEAVDFAEKAAPLLARVAAYL